MNSGYTIYSDDVELSNRLSHLHIDRVISNMREVVREIIEPGYKTRKDRRKKIRRLFD